MHDPAEPSGQPVVRFGVFELDVAAGELRRQGVRTRLQEQPLKVLLLLLSRPGEVVTREELRAQLWPADTFVDFEHSLNAAVKRLRDALGDSADNPRFIETLPRRGYRFVPPVDDPTRGLPAPLSKAASTLTVPRWAAGMAGVVVVLAAAIGLWSRGRHDAPAKDPGPVLTRLTSDPRLTTDPAVSPDGSLLAYASDRGGEGNLDIWVQQLPGGAALRLTRHDAEDHEPSFSPDGTRIVFRSERDGGGIYVVSALGGEERRVAPQGRRPRFSPKGDAIVYWTGSGSGDVRGDPSAGTSGMYVVPATGGPPRQLRPEFATARLPVWSPDGERILFLGVRQTLPHTAPVFDWWITPLGEGEPVATGILAALSSHGLSAVTVPDAWMGDRVLFSDRRGDSVNIWQIALSTDGRPAGAPRQLTFGTGMETQPSLAPGGRLIFSSHSSKVDIWSLPIAANEAKVLGNVQRLTETGGQHIDPQLSRNGKTLAYVSRESGKGDLWLYDLATGRRTALTANPSNEVQPIPSTDGSRVAYITRDFKDRLSPVLVIQAGGGGPERVCDDCVISLSDWSEDGTRFLFLRDQPRRVAVLDVASGRRTDILQHDRHNLYVARFSPDMRWITFLAQTGPEYRRLFAVPWRGEDPIPPSEWIPITDGRFSDDKPAFSPDGNLIYFTSNRDGFLCLWAQRLEPATKHPLGPPFPVHHFHSTGRSMANMPLGWLAISIGADRIVFNQGERTGNIWMSTTAEQR